jgi:hypothetical protein
MLQAQKMRELLTSIGITIKAEVLTADGFKNRLYGTFKRRVEVLFGRDYILVDVGSGGGRGGATPSDGRPNRT